MLRAVANMVGGGFAGSFTTLTVSGQASFAAGTAAAVSVKVGADQSGLYQSSSGNLDIASAGARIARFGTVGGTGNYLDFSANNTPLVLAAGPGANISLQVSSKGTSDLLLATASGINQVRIQNTVGADRYLTLTGSNGGSPTIGTSAGDLSFAPGGSESLRASAVASAVNYLSVAGGAAGNPIGMTAAGSDTNVAMQLSGKGSGTVYTVVRGAASFESTNPASAVNYFQVSGSATGSAVSASAAGADTNIDIAITPKGTGVLRYGTHSALAAETVTGYITIKDAAGNSRKLAVVS